MSKITDERLAQIEAILLKCEKSGSTPPWSVVVELFDALKEDRWNLHHFEAMHMLACGATAEQVASVSPLAHRAAREAK